MHKHLGHALAQSSLAAVLRALKTSAQVPGTQHLLRSCAMVLRLYVHIDETQSLFLAFDLYIIKSKKYNKKQKTHRQTEQTNKVRK
jgi:hypothetical protein